MSVKSMLAGELPKSDLSEIAYRIGGVRDRLEEVCDDWSKQEMYDCIGYQSSVLDELMHDISDIGRVLREVCG